MGEQTQINIRVSKAQKEAWEDHVGKSGKYKTLTGLIRGAVHNEINTESEESQETPPALQNDVQQLREDIEAIKTDVAWLRQREQSDASIEELAQEVFASLEPLPDIEGSIDVPPEEDRETVHNRMAAQQVIEPQSTEEAEEEGPTLHTKHAIAQRIGVEPKQVQSAIDHLQEQFLPVIAVEYDGQTHYFKEE